MEKGKKKILIRVSIAVGFIAIAVGVFFLSYYLSMGTSYSSYETTLKNSIEKVNSINDKTSSLLNGQNVDTAKVKKNLSSIIDSLVNIKNNITASNPPDKLKPTYNKYVAGLENNISLYKELYDLISNQNNINADSINLVTKYRDDCMSNYSLVNYNSVNVSLTDKSITFINSSISYLNNLWIGIKDTQIKQSQNTDFLNTVDGIIGQFNSLKTDYSAAAAKARSSADTYDNVLASIDTATDSLNKLYTTLSNIVLPSSNASASNDALKKLLDDYSSYLQSFKYALSNEKAQAQTGAAIDDNTITTFYSTPTSEFNTINDDYNNFMNVYTKYKSSLSN